VSELLCKTHVWMPGLPDIWKIRTARKYGWQIIRCDVEFEGGE
jgi:hypothetical protein